MHVHRSFKMHLSTLLHQTCVQSSQSIVDSPDSRLGQVLVLRVYEDDDGAQEQRSVWRWIWRAGTAPTCARQCQIDARPLLVLAALCGRVSLGIARDTKEPGVRTLSVAVRTCCRFRRRWVEPSACERVRGSRLVVE